MAHIWKTAESFAQRKAVKRLMTNADGSSMIPANGSRPKQRHWIFPDMIRKIIPYNKKLRSNGSIWGIHKPIDILLSNEYDIQDKTMR